jgi:hypothetical protein
MLEVQIYTLLWRIDPMHTGCAENEGMDQEYARQAHDIAELMAQGVEPRAALLRTFDAWFWQGCLLEPERRPALEALVTALSAGA